MDCRNQVLQLLLEHRGALFSFIYVIVRDFDVAEDVFQEVSLAVCESCQDFRPGTSFAAWAREIARRRILAQRRKTGRFPTLLTEVELAQLAAGFDAAEHRTPHAQYLAALCTCIEKLSPAARRLLELRYAGGFRLGDIAARLSRQTESVRKALYRTRKALRICIEGQTGQGERR